MSLSSPVNFWRLLWDWYIEYLWDYKRGSWVDSSAKSFRIMAWLVIVPFALFIMLDIASYIIARTLGVIDDTKASTSDNASVMSENDDGNLNTPSITLRQPDHPSSVPVPLGDRGESLEDLFLHHEEPQAFGEGNLKLSGVGVFSPAGSRPASPIAERKRLPARSLVGSEAEGEEDEDDESESVKGVVDRDPSWGSFSAESSFTIVDRDSGSEDAGLSFRKRPNGD